MREVHIYRDTLYCREHCPEHGTFEEHADEAKPVDTIAGEQEGLF